MSTRPFLMAAHACRLHGVLRRHGATLTVREIARMLGIPHKTVRRIVRARGWGARVLPADGAIPEHTDEPRALDFEEETQ